MPPMNGQGFQGFPSRGGFGRQIQRGMRGQRRGQPFMQGQPQGLSMDRQMPQGDLVEGPYGMGRRLPQGSMPPNLQALMGQYSGTGQISGGPPGVPSPQTGDGFQQPFPTPMPPPGFDRYQQQIQPQYPQGGDPMQAITGQMQPQMSQSYQRNNLMQPQFGGNQGGMTNRFRGGFNPRRNSFQGLRGRFGQ